MAVARLSLRNECLRRLVRRSRAWTAGLGLLMVTGCDCVHQYSLTYKLWDNHAFSRFNEPARNPDLRLFESEDPKDVLVEYDEYADNRGRTRRRAFYLSANEDRLTARRQPRFLESVHIENLKPIPTVPTPDAPDALSAGTPRFAVISTNGYQFSLCEGEGTQNSFSLPTYETAAGPLWRSLVTPVAVVGDAAMGGLIVGGIGALFVDWGSMTAPNEAHSTTVR